MKQQIIKKSAAVLCFLLLLSCLFSGCARESTEIKELIIGKWIGDGKYFSFYEDGTSYVDEVYLKYYVSDEILTLETKGYSSSYKITMPDKNQLILEAIDPDDTFSIKMFRCDASGRAILGE